MVMMKLVHIVTRGVPQGSVMGPYLWNIAYDFVLCMNMPENCSVICFADDTLFTIGGSNEREVCRIAEQILDQYTRIIGDIGLTISARKTEMMLFGVKKCMNKYIKIHGVVIGSERVFPSNSFKYLGVYI